MYTYSIYLHMLKGDKKGETKGKQSKLVKNTEKKKGRKEGEKEITGWIHFLVNIQAKILYAILIWIGLSFFSKVISSLKQKKTTIKYFQYIPFKEGWYFLQKFLLLDQIFILMFLNHKWYVIKYAFQYVIRVNWLTPLLSDANLYVKFPFSVMFSFLLLSE